MTRTHVTTPALAYADVAETAHVAGECDGCAEMVVVDADGHVSRDGHHYGRVRRWRTGRAWEALGPDGQPVRAGSNAAFTSAQAAVCALLGVSR